MSDGKLSCYSYYSVDKKLIICKVGATIDRIKRCSIYFIVVAIFTVCPCCRAADAMEYQMLFDEAVLEKDVDNGQFPIHDDPDITLIKPYEFIYGKYERGQQFNVV